DVARLLRVRLDELAQAGDLHVEAAVVGTVLPAPRERHELFARHWHARVLAEYLEHAELARRERNGFAVAGEGTGGEIEAEGAELHFGRLGRRGAGRLGRRAAAQHRMDARQQLARVEGLGQ